MKKFPLELKNVTVERDAFRLVIDKLVLRPGTITCIVGPNGGGKTTLLLTVLGLLPHRGTCMVNGTAHDGTQPAIKAQFGYVPDDPSLLFEELTAKEQWRVAALTWGRLQGRPVEQLMERAAALSRQLTFSPPSSIAKSYSHGMRKKTQIVHALMAEPRIIIVDELRNGLDPIAVRQTEKIMQSEKSRGAAIMAATHDLWWAERFADYIYILAKGTIIARGTLGQLLQSGERNLEEAFMRIVENSA